MKVFLVIILFQFSAFGNKHTAHQFTIQGVDTMRSCELLKSAIEETLTKNKSHTSNIEIMCVKGDTSN